MARVPNGVDRARLNVVARRVLLDAITALREQRDAVIVVGAQAVYLRTRLLHFWAWLGGGPGVTGGCDAGWWARRVALIVGGCWVEHRQLS